jgi:hypothetical protein
MMACVILGAFLISSCAPSKGERAASYDAIVQPAGAIGFKARQTLEAYASNNTALASDQVNALTVAGTEGIFLSPGTHVHVIAQATYNGTNPVTNDKNLCRVEAYRVNRTVWLECWDVRAVSTPAPNYAQVAEAHHGPFPSLADPKADARAMVAQFKAPAGTELSDDVYFVPSSSGQVRLWLSFNADKDEQQHLAQATFAAENAALSRSKADAIISEFLPHDASKIPVRTVAAVLSADASGLTKGETVVFYNSKFLERKMDTRQYFVAGGHWKRGRCPGSPPGSIEVFQSADAKQRVKKIIITSMYLYNCEQPTL